MQQRFFSRINNIFVFIFLSLLVAGLIGSSYFVIDYLRKEEVKRINLLTKAIKIQQDIKTPDPAILDLLPEIYASNSTIPVIVTDKNGKPLEHRNLPDDIVKDSAKIKMLAQRMGKNYPAIELKFPDGNNQYVYYDNSRLLNNLRYSPIFIGLIVLGYILFSFWFLRTSKKTDEGFVWAGLAKETAHQIGTPLSSMIGWIEILRMENPDSAGVNEIEKDISRLKTITERFSKIGSVPERNDMNLSETVQQNYDYLKSRISTKVQFTLTKPSSDFLLPHNRILMSWVIENLVKNAVDAMKGTGHLAISMYEKNENIIIDIKDDGCGMTGRQSRKVFKPGFSTKKRGWGLGLSLAKRVITDYHNGDLRVAHTEPGKGTTFRIILKNS